MCDCYGHKCDHPGCEETISIHLQDFETGREEVDVFCYKHLGDSSEGELWDYESDEWDDWDGPPPPEMTVTCRIVPLTENARRFRLGNHPNTGHTRLHGGKGWNED